VSFSARREVRRPCGRLKYIGRQGFCRYYWRLFRDSRMPPVLYCKVDGGHRLPSPVAY
jgi:hypothetical protein